MKLYSKIPHLPGSRVTSGRAPHRERVTASGGAGPENPQGPAPGADPEPIDRRVHVAVAARFLDAAGAGERVIVSEKLDGTCVAIVRTAGVIDAFGRRGDPCAGSWHEGRRAFAAWVRARAARFDGLGEGERLTCEWMIHAHGTRYALPHGPAVVIDGFGADGLRLPLDEVHARARAAGLPIATVLHDGGALALDRALALLGERGRHGALEPAEGVVYRLERRGAVLGLAKYVRPGKVDGCYLADHTGGVHVLNTWQDDPP